MGDIERLQELRDQHLYSGAGGWNKREQAERVYSKALREAAPELLVAHRERDELKAERDAARSRVVELIAAGDYLASRLREWSAPTDYTAPFDRAFLDTWEAVKVASEEQAS